MVYALNLSLSLGVAIKDKDTMQRTLARWKRDVKHKINLCGKTGAGRQPPLSEHEELILNLMRKNKKTTGENLKVFTCR